MREGFTQQDKNDLIDLLISDIHKNKIISDNLNLLFESEHEIEKSFDAIYDLQEKKIDLIAQFNRDYPIENELRKKLDHEVIERKDFKLSQLFGDVKYYSKEVLYQKRDRETFNKWLGKIELLKSSYDNADTQKYLQIVNKVGNYVVNIKDIEDQEFDIRNKSFNIINLNKKYSSQIEEKIAQLSSDFINITYRQISCGIICQTCFFPIGIFKFKVIIKLLK